MKNATQLPVFAPSDERWTKDDVEKAIQIIDSAKHKKTEFIKGLEKVAFILSIVVAIIGNGIVAIVLIPFILTFSSLFLYLVLIIIGLSFGLLFEVLVRDIENLDTRHHIVTSFLIPVLAVISFIMVNNFSKIQLAQIPGEHTIQNPWLMGIVYAISFLIPYLAYHLHIKKKR